MKQLLTACALTTALGACATATRGTNTAWEITTTPPGAHVQTSHGHYCEATPCAMKMPRKSEFTAAVTLDGYEPATVTVTNKVGGGGGAAMAGNVILGGVIGAGVDVASGAMLDLVPNPVHLDLKKLDGESAAAPSPAEPGASEP